MESQDKITEALRLIDAALGMKEPDEELYRKYLEKIKRLLE